MIHNIIFDMGQVLIRWQPDLLAAGTGVPAEDVPLLQKAVFGSVQWIQLDRGVISQEDALSAMCRELPERLHAPAGELVRSWWKQPLRPVPGMEALIAELKGLGYGIYLLSNASVALPEYFSRIPGSQYFDGKIVSADWKLLKPQHEIYETLFREYRLKPEECFFIDDLNINIEGAWYTGMAGAVFDGDLSRLRQALRASGVPVS
ncbi:HAD family phosphatase [Oscillospiraceae bacterium 38-13]|jgi:putative hydrolase of the HAD superfamily